jgi:virginiamycin B lyase
MAQLRIFVLSAVFSFVSFPSLAATGVFRDRLIPGPPGGLTDLVLFAAQNELYFTEFDANRIGRLSRDGQFREFAVPTPDSGPRGIASGFNAIWFTESKAGKIGKLTPDGVFTEYVTPSAGSAPWGIAVIGTAPWFTESAANKIGRVNADGSITEFAIPTKDAIPRGITGQLSDRVCFAEFGADQIGCLENGQFAERALSPGSGPQDIALSTNWADLWFTESTGNRIGVLRFAGVNGLAQARVEEFPIPASASGLSGIATDYYEGSAWFTEGSAGQIGFISRDGRITEYPLTDRSSRPTSIVLSFLGAQFLEAATNRAVEIQPDAVLVAGAGSSGRWETQLQVGNVSPRPMTVFAGLYPKPPTVCAGDCFPSASVPLPANGSGQVRLDSSKLSELFTFFVRVLEEGDLPAVRGRIYNRDFPSQSADLPAIRLSTLTSLNPETLFFPGAVRLCEYGSMFSPPTGPGWRLESSAWLAARASISST